MSDKVRNDSYLYTGVTSLSNEPRTPRELQRQSKEIARQKLKPAADQLLEFLEVEKNALYDMRSLIVNTKTTDDEIRIERLLRQRHEILITKLEQKIKTIMRVRKTKEVSDE